MKVGGFRRGSLGVLIRAFAKDCTIQPRSNTTSASITTKLFSLKGL
jgi:hypothetical protein